MGCQVHAGVLEGDGDARELTYKAKKKFIEEVKQELLLGTAGIPTPPLPCGPKFGPVPFANQLELEDEKKYPEFHANVLGMYKEIAKALDVDSQFTIPPIFDPLALAFALNLKIPRLKFPYEFSLYGISLPLLAIKLGLEPPELALKFPSLVVPPIPKLNLPLPVDIKIPDFQALFDFSFWPDFMIDIIVNLMLDMPSLFLKLLSLDLSVFCDAVFSANIFGPFDPTEALVWAVASKVLVRKTAECVSIAVVASTVGTASGGITGHLGGHYGYDPPEQEYDDEDSIRDKVVRAAQTMIGESWSKDKRRLADAGGDFSKADLKYTQWMFPFRISPPPNPSQPIPLHDPKVTAKNLHLAYISAKEASSCGLFVRGCFIKGGALDPRNVYYFNVPYRDATAISGLIQVANLRGAIIPFSKNNIPSLKRGDAILVKRPNEPGTEHVLMLTDDFPGGLDSTAFGIQGGSPDADNPGGSTAVTQSSFKFFVKNGVVRAGDEDEYRAWEVTKLIDAEKICNNEEPETTN